MFDKFEMIILCTASHHHWGNIKSFENDGILLNTVEGQKWYDFNTRKVKE